MKVEVKHLVDLTTQSKPAAATHWSTRKLAAELGVAASTVWRHWHSYGLKPHVVLGFKVSRDPQFVGEGRRHRGWRVADLKYLLPALMPEALYDRLLRARDGERATP